MLLRAARGATRQRVPSRAAAVPLAPRHEPHAPGVLLRRVSLPPSVRLGRVRKPRDHERQGVGPAPRRGDGGRVSASTRAELGLGAKARTERVAPGRRLHLRLIEPSRPVVRGECKGGARPCPWVSCRYHLAVDVLEGSRRRTTIREVFPDRDLGELADTCALDVADRGPHSFGALARRMNLTRARVMQIVHRALHRLGKRAIAKELAP